MRHGARLGSLRLPRAGSIVISRYYCMVCGDDLVQVQDAAGDVWWEHVHRRNDDHKVAPAYERPYEYGVVDYMLAMMLIGLGLIYFFMTR